MKRLILGAAALLCMAGSLAAFNWGGLFTNTSKITTSDFSEAFFYQSNGISLWASQAFNKNLRFTAEGVYKYELNAYADESDITNILDLSLLKLSGNWSAGSGTLALNAGRFSYSDLSSAVFSQTADSLYLSFQMNAFKIDAYAAYTGLLNSLTVSMLDINPDAGASPQLYQLCPGYVPLALQCSLLNLGGTNLSLQGEYFIAANNYCRSRFYATVAADGRFSSMVGYSVSAVLGSEEFNNLMLFGKGNVSCFIGKSIIASAGAEYASGENGGLSSFKTISSRTAYNGRIFYETSGVIIPQCSVLLALDSMVVSLGEKVVIGIPDGSAFLRGFDTNLNFVCNVMSDVQIGCSVIAYYDRNDSANSNYSFALNASLAF